MTLGTDVTKQVYSGKSWNREPNLCGTKRKPRIQVIRKIGRGHVTSRGPVLHLSHADYNGEQLRKLGERLARGSELHLNNINLSRVWEGPVQEWRAEESCQRHTAMVWASGHEGMHHGGGRGGKGRTAAGDCAGSSCAVWPGWYGGQERETGERVPDVVLVKIQLPIWGKGKLGGLTDFRWCWSSKCKQAAGWLKTWSVIQERGHIRDLLISCK